jgi:4-hydroxybenzoate polyprenyltransferase
VNDGGARLGPLATLRALVVLSRPAGMLLVALLPILGFVFAYWDHGCIELAAISVPRLALLALIWAVPHAGTMWLNAALDRDEAPTLFGRKAAVPAHIEAWAYGSLALSLAAAAWLGWWLFLSVLGCALLSVLYSHPRTAWKGHALLGPLVNVLGYGVLSPLGGFFFAGFPPTLRGLAVLLTALPWIATAYFAAQAFQEDEDRARGYRTLVATRGAAFTLQVTRGMFLAALALTAGLAALGWFPRLILASLPLFFWVDRLLVAWTEVPGGGDAGWAKRYFLRLTATGLAVLALVSLDYELSIRSTGRPGGLTTASGRSEPRRCEGLWPPARVVP